MSDPRRLKDDPSALPELRRLLAAAPRSRGPTDEQRRRGRERVAAIAAVPVAASILATALKALATGVGLAIVGAIVVAGARLGPAAESPAPPAPVRTVRATAAAPEAMPERAEVEPAPEPAPESLVAPPERWVARERASAETVDDLAAETALLQRAEALVSSDPARALAETRAHAQRFPRGQLEAERELIAARALIAGGRERAGRARAERLVRRHPRSLAASRAREILGAP